MKIRPYIEQAQLDLAAETLAHDFGRRVPVESYEKDEGTIYVSSEDHPASLDFRSQEDWNLVIERNEEDHRSFSGEFYRTPSGLRYNDNCHAERDARPRERSLAYVAMQGLYRYLERSLPGQT